MRRRVAVRRRRRHLGNETPQRRFVIHVVPLWKLDQLKPERGNAFARLTRDGIRAPGNVGKKMRLGPLHAHEIITAIGGRAERDAVTRRQQRLGSPA